MMVHFRNPQQIPPRIVSFVYTSHDAGLPWNSVPTPKVFSGIHMFFSTSRWLVQSQGTFLVTADAGARWNQVAVTSPPRGTTGNGMFQSATPQFVTPNTGFFFSRTIHAVWTTMDGGVTWKHTVTKVTNPAAGTLGPSSR